MHATDKNSFVLNNKIACIFLTLLYLFFVPSYKVVSILLENRKLL